jgi:hypothetical protein
MKDMRSCRRGIYTGNERQYERKEKKTHLQKDAQ